MALLLATLLFTLPYCIHSVDISFVDAISVQLPDPKRFSGACTGNKSNMLYVIGGSNANNIMVDTVYKIDLSLPTPVFNLLSVVADDTFTCDDKSVQVGDLIYMIHPFGASTSSYIFDMDSETFISNSIPSKPLDGMDYCVTYDPSTSRIYVIGGWVPPTSTYYFLDYVQIYDIQFNKWLNTEYADRMPQGLAGGSCEYFNGNIYYFGGFLYPSDHGSNYIGSDTVYKYVVSTNKWNDNSIATLSNPRSKGKSVITDTHLILYIGGYNFASIDIFDPSTDTIIGTSNLNHPRQRFFVGQYNHKIFVFQGQYGYYSWVEYSIYSTDMYPAEISNPITFSPTPSPTITTLSPSLPTNAPSNPTSFPSVTPTLIPTNLPTITPTFMPSDSPTIEPTFLPTLEPTYKPTMNPTHPTKARNEMEGGENTSTTSTTQTVIQSDIVSEGVGNVNDIDKKLQNRLGLIIFFMVVSLLMGGLCFLYLLKKEKLSDRTNKIGTATLWHTMKEMECSEKFGLLLEISDILTDYLYSTQLILGEETMINVFGWLLLIFSIGGILLFLFKLNLMKKLIGKQCFDFKLQRKQNEITENELNEEVKRRILDVSLFSFICSTFEDIPQCIISISISTTKWGWSFISILTLTLSLISFFYKLIKIISIKVFGMFDFQDPKKQSFVQDTTDGVEMPQKQSFVQDT